MAREMTNAEQFRCNYSDTNELMSALDAANVDSCQDWHNESTTWTFDDGSQIVVCGSQVEVK